MIAERILKDFIIFFFNKNNYLKEYLVSINE